MMVSLLRILFGLLVACLAAGLTQVLFVITPAELIGLDSSALIAKLGQVGVWTLLAATQIAIFSMAFAGLAVAFGEWQGIRSWLYYAAAAMAIAAAGFLVQYTGEGLSLTIVNDYALRSFLAAGLIGGLAYWAVGGRKAGRHSASATVESPQS